MLIPSPKFFGWIVVFLAFASITTYGLFYSYSAFIGPLEAELHTTRAAISAAYTIYMLVYCFCAIPMGWFSDRYGPRKILCLASIFIGCGITLCSLINSLWQLYIFFGVIAAIGHGAIYVVPASAVSRWFIKSKGLALGITLCGLGFGLLVVPPITAQTITTYGWRVAFVMLGAIFFTINLIVGIFIRGKPEDMGLRPLGGNEEKPSASKPGSINSKDFSIAETLKTKAFWLIYLVCVFCFGAEQMVLVHVVPYSSAFGIPMTKATLGLSFLGLGTIIGRVSVGALSDRIGRVPSLIICCSIEAFAIFCFLAIRNLATLCLTMFVLGFGYGGWAVLCTVMLGDFFGLKNLAAIMGIWFTCGVPAGVLGPLIGGIIFDLTKSYSWAIILAGAVCAVSVGLVILIKHPQKAPQPETDGTG